jgi:hypothetical protein
MWYELDFGAEKGIGTHQHTCLHEYGFQAENLTICLLVKKARIQISSLQQGKKC